MSSESKTEWGTCHVCRDAVPVDGDRAIERFGDVLCRDCSGEPVAFIAVCDSLLCSWSSLQEDTEFNRGHVEQLVRSEANSHERRKLVFDDDPCHTVTVHEVDLDEGVDEAVRGGL